MLRYKALLLDVDNTLINTDDLYPTALHYVYLEHFKDLTDIVTFDEFKDVYKQVKQRNHSNLKATGASHSRTLYFKYLLQHFGLDYDLDLLLKMQADYWDYVLKHAKIYSGVIDFLSKAKNSFMRVAVVTDNRLEVQLQKIAYFRLDKYIDVVISSEEAGGDKPAQAIFLFALNEIDARRTQSLIVGNNSFSDILGGNITGIDTCQYLPGALPTQYSDKIKSKYTIKNYEQLQEILLIKDREFTKDQAVVFDFVGGLVLPNHPLRDILLKIIKQNYKDSNVSYDKLVHLYFRLIYGEMPEKTFWNLLGVSAPEQVLVKFFGQMSVSLRIVNIMERFKKDQNNDSQLVNTKIVIATNLYSKWWKYAQNVFDFTKYADFVSFPDTVGFKKEDTDYWYQIFYRFPRIPAKNYIFYDSNLTVLKTLKHFWGKKVWIKSEEQKFVFIPDEIVEVG